jgi:formylglycine-generating enzyme required for sulfatase activity
MVNKMDSSKRYFNNSPLHTRSYKVVVKKYSGNIYLVNVDDFQDFFQYNGDPKDIDPDKIYRYTELDVKGSYAKIRETKKESRYGKFFALRYEEF